MKRLFLAAGLLTALTSGALAREPRPAVFFLQELSAKQSAALGTYKAETPGVPTIVIKAKGTQLIMAAEGYPETNVTINDKDELVAEGLPADFKFTLVRDADKKITGLKVETPMGGGELKRVPDAKPAVPAVEAKKADVPDILGVYESDELNGMRLKSEVVFEKGKLLLKSEGQPDMEVKVGKDDTLTTEPAIPDVTSIKLTRDKDGKVTGSTVETAQGKLNFTRKTFPKPPGAEVAKPEAPAVPDMLGKYECETENSPVAALEVVLREGKLYIMADGQPDIEFTLDKADNVVAPKAPEGITSKLTRDKDGKITHLIADTPVGKLSFKRTTFPKPPVAEKKAEPEKKADAADPVARLKALEGIYTSDMPGLPTVTMRIKDGKLVVEPEGNDPISDAKLSDKDEISGAGLPDGFTITIQRDKEGKVTGMLVKTPMGDANFKRAPLK